MFSNITFDFIQSFLLSLGLFILSMSDCNSLRQKTKIECFSEFLSLCVSFVSSVRMGLLNATGRNIDTVLCRHVFQSLRD